ncbi:Pentatricopeptide repeat-containing protein [Apostasia shenzhenica]|uniref:Pentatricopeptide repeat-containing protein n=1 Tax=Apostasia shenzhenica TaxID=1088818 RepID=A0A2I0ASZ5_9ASPA|nr:Pentatricopeptide repeat-containing protein [Apostasia shenzhenica]
MLPSLPVARRQYLAATAAAATIATTPFPSSSSSDDYLSLFRSAISSFSRRSNPYSYPLPRSAPRHFLRLLVRPSTASYNALINCLLLANCPAAAAVVCSSLLASGLPISTSSFTIFLKLILSSARSDRFDAAYSLLGVMVRRGKPPDAVTFSTLIAALSRAGRLTEALGVLDLMLDSHCRPTPHACTSLIHGYCSHGMINKAKHFLNLVEKFGLAPDTFMYTALIDALSRNGKFDEVEKLLSESHEKGWKPDEVTYNVYMNGLCKAGRIGEAFRLLNVLRGEGLLPSLETLNILFECLCKMLKLQEALKLLESSEIDWTPDAVFYNTLMSSYLDGECSVNALQLLGCMVKRGIEPDSCTLTLILRSICATGNLHLAKNMVNTDWRFVPDVVTFNVLIHQFYTLGKNKEALELFAEMMGKNVNPNKYTYQVVIGCLCGEERVEEAIDLVLGTVTDGFMQDLVNHLLCQLGRGKRLGEVLKLFQKMFERHLVIDFSCFNSLIHASCKAGICQSQDFYRLSIIIEKGLGVR